jgi:Domain of unknown function (DUF4157)
MEASLLRMNYMSQDGSERIGDTQMKTYFLKALALVLVGVLLAGQAQASWFSDLTGINIDPWHGQFQIGIPQPGRAIQQLPGEIQRLPQIVANLFNPAGLALAAAVRQGEAQAGNGARPMPANVYQQLQGYYAPDFLQSVRYNTFDSARISLDSAVMMLNNDVAAITLNNIIVFRNENDAQNVVTWAHELTHVIQYRNMGIDTFTNVYTIQAWILENQAIDMQNRVAVWLMNGAQQGQQQFAYFNVTGQLLYGDSNGYLYPANPANGQVMGPANGRVFFQNGQYWAVDSFGRTWLATRVQ